MSEHPFIDFYNLHAREKYGLPAEWEWYSLEAKGEYATGYTAIKGGIPRSATRRAAGLENPR